MAAIRQALRTHFPEASACTVWQHQSDSVTSLSPLGPRAPPTAALCRVTCWAPSRARWSWVVTTCAISSPLTSRPRASAMNGSLTMGNSSPDPGPLIRDFVLWTPPSRLRGARQRQELWPPPLPARPHVGVCVVGHAVRPRHCVPSSARTRGPWRWGPLSALVRTSMRVPGNRCVLAARCAPRSSASTFGTRGSLSYPILPPTEHFLHPNRLERPQANTWTFTLRGYFERLSTNWAEYFAKGRELPTSSSSQWSSTSWFSTHSWSSNRKGWRQPSWQDDK